MHVSSRNMFPTIRNLQIRVHVYCPRLSVVLFRWLPIMTLWRKDKQSWMLRQARTHSWQWLMRNLSVSCRVNHFFVCAIFLMWYTLNIFLLASDIFFINWTVRMSDNLPKRVKSWVTRISFTVRENRIICLQIFCDLLLKSAFERIFNVMQLILVKIKWHFKWKYLIQKFHDICLSYYFNRKTQNSCWTTNCHVAAITIWAHF